MDRQWRVYAPYRSPFDPCPPTDPKAFIVPPNQYVVFQPKGLRQFAPREALKRGTLWPDLYSPYDPPKGGGQ
ncbi:spore coat associated protein CotJA [Alicyclobacillus sp. ALC3]|uniref:spore coat associated protein CotJA n=1 Tax=Alicyclobacillus sp. ALC3 TaxID=2796143 RepID=UPI002379AFAB|nr:spore coat associated protein CotJA [Alicyclobacillus sp. ALC3]WDL96087.1 spore coat associated protein CotJA [Alicyclobacillus sp. ALC3]